MAHRQHRVHASLEGLRQVPPPDGQHAQAVDGRPAQAEVDGGQPQQLEGQHQAKTGRGCRCQRTRVLSNWVDDRHCSARTSPSCVGWTPQVKTD